MTKFGSRIVLISAIGVSVLVSTNAIAAPRTHDGFYLQLDAGLGYLSSTAKAGGTEITYSGVTTSSALFLGGTIGPVVIGGGLTYDNAFSPKAESGGSTVDLGDSDISLHLIGFGPFVDVYPDPNSGLHFMGFVGWGGLEASQNGNVSGSDPTGMVASIGGGYEFWIANEWSIGPLARLTYAPLSRNGVDFNTTAFAVVADFKFH
jgi:Autotransporter beta-domain